MEYLPRSQIPFSQIYTNTTLHDTSNTCDVVRAGLGLYVESVTWNRLQFVYLLFRCEGWGGGLNRAHW